MKRWVQLAMVSLLLVALINLGLLNHQTTKQRLEMSRIGLMSQMSDMDLLSGIQVVYGRTKDLDAADAALYNLLHNNTTELANRLGQTNAAVEDAQMGVGAVVGAVGAIGKQVLINMSNIDAQANAVQNVVTYRMPSTVAVCTELLYITNPYTGQPVFVSPVTKKPFISHCAGVVIDEGTVLTAAHVLASDDPMRGPIVRQWVEFEDGTQRDAIGSAFVKEQDPDVGVVWFDPTGLDVVAVPLILDIRESLRKGDPIVVLGSPMGYMFSVSVGVVAAPVRVPDVPGLAQGSFLQVSGHIAGGNSGGPVFDLQGNLLGIVSMGAPGTGVFFVVPIDEIMRRGLHKCNMKETVNVL